MCIKHVFLYSLLEDERIKVNCSNNERQFHEDRCKIFEKNQIEIRLKELEYNLELKKTENNEYTEPR
ncbi:MAG: hypothetical protein Fur0024_5630 [Patescibacteria group bacterium]